MKDIQNYKRKTIEKIFTDHEQYVVIGLTGKIGSGCSDVARRCCKSMNELGLSQVRAGVKGFYSNEERDLCILQRFYEFHGKWTEFHVIKVRDVILSFILESEATWNRFLHDCADKGLELTLDKLWKGSADRMAKLNDILEEMKCNTKGSDIILDIIHSFQKTFEKGNQQYSMNYRFITDILPLLGDIIHDSISLFYTELFQEYGNELRFFGSLNKENWKIYGMETQTYTGENVYTIGKRINSFIKFLKNPKSGEQKEPVFAVIDSMKSIYDSAYLKDRYSSYYLISISREEQGRKTQIREKKSFYSEEDIQYLDFNERPKEARKKLRPFIKCLSRQLESWDKEKGDKNNKEYMFMEYLHEIEEGEYLKIIQRVIEGNVDFFKEMRNEINSMNWDQEIYKSVGKEYFTYYKRILFDPLRIFAYGMGIYQFYLQDVEACIQNADIFFNNNEKEEAPHSLDYTIIRYLSLMLHPGLVTPTEVERCMQIAYTAKVNSGCISRQVGAVVTDSDFNILSLGWNDVPCGQVQCNRRNLVDLRKGVDDAAYSNYEKNKNSPFREYLDKYNFNTEEAMKKLKDVLMGLPAAFCFKDFQKSVTGENNPMAARAMHGEEKALLTCDQQRVRGGYLFTTSSPCEMCAKNAKEHHIKKIYFIEPYPGISQTHICDSGNENNRATYEFFEGAIGRAYTQLYTPVIPYKDELELRGLQDFKNSESGIKDAPVRSQKDKKDPVDENSVAGKKNPPDLDKQRNAAVSRKDRLHGHWRKGIN